MTATLRRDVPAGLAVFLVSVPLCLGIAHASGAPAASGMISGVLGGVLAGALSGSALNVSGPAAGLVPIVWFGTRSLGSFSAFLTATILAGLLQIGLGLLRAGSLSRLFPSSVIRGLMGGIGLVLVMSQLPHLLGYDLDAMGWESVSLKSWSHLESLQPVALSLGLVSLALLVSWEIRMHARLPHLPGPVVVLPLMVAVYRLLVGVWPGLALSSEHLVQVPAWHQLRLAPDWSVLNDPKVYWVALTLALVATLESLLATEAGDRLDPEHRDSPLSRELVAQGVTNLACGWLGGLPITTVIARTSVNAANGAGSRIATITSGALLLLALLALQPLLNLIPLACLAAVLIVVGAALVRPANLRAMLSHGPSTAVPYLVTMFAMAFTNMLTAVGLGLAAAAGYILKGLYASHGFDVEVHGRIVEIRLLEEVTFFHKFSLNRVLRSVQSGQLVSIDGSHSRTIDYDIIEAILEYRERAARRNIQVVVGGIPDIPSYSEAHMSEIENEYRQLIENNRAWVEEKLRTDPGYFEAQSKGQTPAFLFIGCSDSRVPAETITKTDPGRLFVHRNIANLVSPQDVNLMSVLQYSVEVLNVPHIIVCGHYGCGGVKAALGNKSLGLIDNWINPIKTTVRENEAELAALATPEERERRVIELSVMAQVRNLLRTSIVQRSMKAFGRPRVHGWVYDLATGLINDLQVELTTDDISPVFRFE